MKITVAICTLNRARLLGRALAGMRGLKVPQGIEWELLVVNNNCTDNTDEVIASYSGHLPVRRIFEAKPTVANARNAAIKNARGDYILWADDDVLVDRDWLLVYLDAFRRWPDAAVFGGPISPWFEGTPPQWLSRIWGRVEIAYAMRDLGDEHIPLLPTLARLPFGANFCVRTQEQRRHLYDPAISRQAEVLLSGEELEVICDILKEGGTGWWLPGAKVEHWIPQWRQSIKYLRDFYIGCGQTSLVLECCDVTSVRLFGKPRYLWRRAVESEIKYRIYKLFSTPERWIEYLISASIAWGQLGLRTWDFPT
jgi:glycosyltransferase involved in cell wall biosynthesis